MRNLFGVFLLLFGLSASAQLSLTKSQIDFGTVQYKADKTQQVTISNSDNFDVNVTVKCYSKDFFVDDSSFVIRGNKSHTVNVFFSPRYNMTYNQEVVFVSSSRYGSLALDVRGKGQYDAYYASTFDKRDEDLKSALKSIISANYRNLGYTAARDAMYSNIDNVNGKVTCVYTGREATFNSRSGANSNNFNCEHTWPQSLFNQNEPERADIHHLFPTDAGANSRRSNYRFNVVSNASWSEGGSKLGSGIFEPRDEHKGDVARAMMYFAVRYQNYSSFLTNQETLLREWHNDKLPNDWSRKRNEAIFGYQRNRNPFVDYPEFTDRITSISTTANATLKAEITPSVDEIRLSGVPTWTSPYKLVLTNTGTASATINLAHSSSDITLSTNTANLQPGESITIEVTFKPTTQPVSDIIEVSGFGDNLDIKVSVGMSNIENINKENLELITSEGQIGVIPNQSGELYVMDIQGKTVFFTEIQSPFTEIMVDNLQSGAYFVCVKRKSNEQIVQRVWVP